MRKLLPILLIVLFFFISAVEKNEFIEKVDDGSINWTNGTVSVTGSGVPDLNIQNGNSARLFCEKVALKNAGYRLTKILGNISLDGKVTVSQFIKERKDITFEVPGSKADPTEKTDVRNYSDGAVDFTLLFPIKNSINEVCNRYKEQLQKGTVSTKVVRNLPVDEKVLYARLVIEVKKKKFTPVLFPRVISDDGRLIYGLEKQSQNGDCGEPARYSYVFKEKSGLYVKAVKVNKNKEIVLSQEDDLKIKTQLKDGVLEKGRVLIVLK